MTWEKPRDIAGEGRTKAGEVARSRSACCNAPMLFLPRLRSLPVLLSLFMVAPAAAEEAGGQPPPAPPPATAPTTPRNPASAPAPAAVATPGAPVAGPTPSRAAPRRRKFTPRAPKHGKRVRVELPPGDVPLAGSPGFYRLDGGGTRIALEVSRKVEIAESRSHLRLVYRLRNTWAVDPTSQLPLVTGFIVTPVDRVSMVKQGPDVDLVIDLRQQTEVAFQVVETPRGIVLQVDFPAIVDPVLGRETARDNGSAAQPLRREAQSLQSNGREDAHQGHDVH